jgi:GAF domain-containing protein
LAQLTSATNQAGLAEEHAALRRVATLVAQQPSPEEVFTAVTEAVGPLLGADLSALMVYPEDGTAVTTIAGWSAAGPMIPIGTRYRLDGDSVTARIFRTASSARMDSYVDVDGAAADIARSFALRSTVGAPIIVDGKLWGALMVATRGAEPLPETTEARMAAFTELVATAISNVEARRDLQRIATEQEALRKAATLVASGASPNEVFAQITASASEVFGVPFASLIRLLPDRTATMVAGCEACGAYVGMSWEVPENDPGIASQVMKTGKPARVEDHSRVSGPVGEAARTLGVGSVAGAPVVVDGEAWGVLVVGAARDGPALAADAGERLASFSDLVTTALSNAEAREALTASEARARELASEQAALRRVATLAARESSAVEVLEAVAQEAARVLEVDAIGMIRFEPDETATLVAQSETPWDPPPLGTSFTLDGENVVTWAHRTRQVVRMDDWEKATGSVAALASVLGVTSAVASPIVVEGRPWGIMVAATNRSKPLPSDTEGRVVEFAKLLATAISNAESREALTRLAEEQAALGRVATLVAAGIAPDELFSAVSEEVAALFGADSASVGRFEPDGSRVVAVGRSKGLRGIPVGTHADVDRSPTLTEVRRTGRAARWSDQFYSSVAAPITVGGNLWGVLEAGSGRIGLPPDTEARLEKFGELVATAIANAESRAALAASEARARELASVQAALRRVATLVAQGASPDELFSAVAAEAAAIIELPVVGVARYEADETISILGIAGESDFSVGSSWPIEEEGVAGLVRATAQPSRWDDYSTMPGPLGEAVRNDLLGSTVGVPIMVEGRVWGLMVAAAKAGAPIPTNTESQLTRFTELVATAVSNASARTELLTSRARLVTTADETRRRLERDLHDGIQQWLVALALRARRASLSASGETLVHEMSGLADDLTAVTDELREISRGIHPAVLSDAGLDDALAALVRRSAIHIDLDVNFQRRYDPTVEATAYYVVAESITNAVKHAQASAVAVRGGLRGETIELEIADDGVGGAAPGPGTGLMGLKDRVDTLGGTISLASPIGEGTTIRVRLPASPAVGDPPAAFPRSDAPVSTPTRG